MFGKILSRVSECGNMTLVEFYRLEFTDFLDKRMAALKTFARRSINGDCIVPFAVVKIGEIPAVNLIPCVVAFAAAHIVKINR